MKTLTSRLGLRIDGDVVVRRVACRVQADPNGSLELANIVIRKMMKYIYRLVDTQDVRTFLGNTDKAANFRYEIYPDYKSNRADIVKPMYYHELRHTLIKNYDAEVVDWGESDDWLGVDGENNLIVSIDKDLLQLPGAHFRMHNNELYGAEDPGELWLTEKRKLLGLGFKWFCAQILLGDTVDCIPRLIKGMGDVRVFKILDASTTVETLWKTIVDFFEKHGLTKEQLLLQAQLVWISRRPREIFSFDIVEELIDYEKSKSNS